MRRFLIALLLLLHAASASAQVDTTTSIAPDGQKISPTVLWCRSGNGLGAVPCGGPDSPLTVLGMPFQRAGDPFLMPATTTPQQYSLPQPSGTRSYRGVNPCTVDIRIKTVASLLDTVTPATGTRFLARTAETLASSPSLTGQTRIVSIMTMADPGAGGCVFELGYGNGG